MGRHRRGRHEGTIRKRRDGRWEAAYRIGGDRRYITGRRGESRDSVALKLAEAISRERFGLDAWAYRESFGRWLDEWLESVRVSRRPKTFESYQDTVRLHIAPIIGHVSLRRIAAEHVQQAMTAAADAGLSPRTVAYVRSVIRRALHVAQRRRLVIGNAAELVDPPAVPKKEVAIPHPEEWKAFTRAVKKDPYEPLFLFLAIVGGRRGEILGLKWTDLDEVNGVVRISRSLQRIRKSTPKRGRKQENELKLLEVKTPTSRRALRLPKIVLQALRRYRKRQTAWQVAAADLWQDSGLIFTTHIGTPIHPDNVKRMLAPILDAAGIGHRTVHELRHIAISNLLAAGVRIEVVSPMAGHASIRTTKDVYGHIVPPMMDAAVDAMEKIGRR